MSDITIDKIQIEVEAKAKNANKVLQDLERNLSNINKALTGFDTSGLENLKKTLDDIASKGKNISVTPKVDTSELGRAERKLDKELGRIKDKFTEMGPLLNSALGGDKSAITSFQRQATSLQGKLDVLKEHIKGLGDTRVQTDAFVKLDSQIEKTQEKLKTLKIDQENIKSGKTVVSDDVYVQIRQSIIETKRVLDDLIDKQNEMLKNGTAYTDPFQHIRDGAVEVQGSLDDAVKATQEAGEKVSETKFELNTSMVMSALKQVATQTTKTIKKLLQLVGGTIKKGFSALANSIHKVKDALSGTRKASEKLNGFMNKGFMRILKYGFGIRSLYVGFRRLRKAVVESFGELQKSGAFYETTKQNIDDLKKSLALLKYQFGAAFEPIFNAVAPALKTFINYVLKATNAFSAFTASIMGKSSYSKAVIATQQIEENTSGAAAAVKEMKKQLQGFDELNNLTTNDSSGKGKTGSDDGEDISVTYVSENVDNVLGDFGKTLANLIKNGDWGGVGTAISEKLTAVLKDLNSKWPEIFEKAADFGTKLAEFFKGLITPELFGEIGKALGNALKAALTLTFNFAKTMGEVITEGENKGKTGWQVLGESIAAGINEFVKTNPLKLVVANFNEWANGILTTLITAIDGIEWDTVAEHIATAISEIDASGIGWKLGKLANSLANAFYTLVSKKETWTNLGQKIADGINNFFSGMNEIDPKTGLSGWQALGKSISETLVGIATAITKALEEIDWEEVGQGIADFIASIDWTQIKWALGKLGDAFKEALKGLLKGLDIDAGDIVIGLLGVSLVVQSIAGISLASTVTKIALSTMIKNAVTGLLAGGGAAEGAAAAGGATVGLGAAGEVLMTIGSVALNIAGVTLAMAASATIGWKFGTTFGEFIAYWLKDHGIISSEAADEYYTIAEEMSFTQKVKDIVLAAGEKTAGGENRLKKAFEDMVYAWYEPVFDEGMQLCVSVKELVLNVKDMAVSIGGKIMSAAEAWNDFWGDVGEAAYDKTIAIKTKFEDTKESFKKKWDDTTSNIFNKVNEIKMKAVETKDSMLTDIKTKIDGVKQVTVNFLSKGAQKVVKNIKSIQTAFKKVKNSKIRITEEAGSKLRDIKDKFSSIARNLQYLKDNAKVKIEASFNDKFTDPLEKAWKRMIDSLKRMKANEKGGVYSNGTWKNIPQYASGTIDALKHGSVFVAGENGPEVAGHINGRTEILNRSQLASIMYTSITRGMAQFRNAQMVKPPQLEYANGIVNAMADGVARANDSSSIAEQNRLLEEQNRLLRQIASKDVTISSRDIFRATQKEARDYSNRTGASPFLI